MPMCCPNCGAACLPQKGGWLRRLLGILKSTNMFETELTAAQQQEIMQRTGWSMAVVGCIRTMDEVRIYMNVGLMEARIGGRPALIRTDIDWSAFNC